MTRPVVWLSEADIELAKYRLDFECKSAGLGVRFATEALALARVIETNPKLFAVHNRKNVRVAMNGRFKFGILYQIKRTEILIIGVVPLQSNPITWMNRG